MKFLPFAANIHSYDMDVFLRLLKDQFPFKEITTVNHTNVMLYFHDESKLEDIRAFVDASKLIGLVCNDSSIIDLR